MIEGSGEAAAEGVRDVVRALAPSAAETVGDAIDLFVPGVKALGGAWKVYNAHQADKFLRRLSQHLGYDDGEMAAKLLADRSVDKAFRDRVIQGFRLVLESWDELTQECVTLLVADHVRGTHAHRDYQLAARLLAECDEVMLRHLERIARMYVDVLDRVVSPEITERHIATHSPGLGEQWIWVFAGHTAWGMNGAAASRWERVVEPAFDVTISALQRVDFGAAYSEGLGVPGMPETDGQSGERVYTFIGARHDARMRALNTYLQPVRLKLGKL